MVARLNLIANLVLLLFVAVTYGFSAVGQTRRSGVSPAPQPASPGVTPPSARQLTSTEGPAGYPRPVQDILEAQIALARQRLSPGSIDGVLGHQTRSALQAFQCKSKLPATGDLDDLTRTNLLLLTPPLQTLTVSSNDVSRLQPLSDNWVGKAQQSRLDFVSVLECIAEKTQSSPRLLVRLNPGVNWTNVAPGATILCPDPTCNAEPAKAASISISLSRKTLCVFDSNTNLLAHFPCSIASRMEKRPVGSLQVVAIAPDPNYTFDPSLFPESVEARSIKTKLILPPGPNNPVGIAWIGLDKPGYGMHGTPNPEQVGRTESHGCFRLANWNAAALLNLVSIGLPVSVEP